MELSVYLFLGLLLAVGALRICELEVSKRHQRRLSSSWRFGIVRLRRQEMHSDCFSFAETSQLQPDGVLKFAHRRQNLRDFSCPCSLHVSGFGPGIRASTTRDSESKPSGILQARHKLLRK